MKTRDRIVFILVIGVLSLVGAVIIGEMYLCHTRGESVSTEAFTLIKMSITGLIGIIAGYMGGRSKEE